MYQQVIEQHSCITVIPNFPPIDYTVMIEPEQKYSIILKKKRKKWKFVPIKKSLHL